MIEQIEFKNFKALRDTKLPLGQFTLIVGPNGSGKSTALQGINAFRHRNIVHQRCAAVGFENQVIQIRMVRGESVQGHVITLTVHPENRTSLRYEEPGRPPVGLDQWPLVNDSLQSLRVYSLEASQLAAEVHLTKDVEMNDYGSGLAGALDRLRDKSPERFELLNQELGRWLPEFDRVLFETPQPGYRSFLLRTKIGGHGIPATELSQGTLLALAIFSVAFGKESPLLVGFEEPDRGLHPRLLRDVRDALYRLAYPENFGERRQPVQVVATTHSPYFLDLFRDHPEEIVIAEKVGAEAQFKRLIDIPHYEEILDGAHLGDVWYSGILGGVPTEP